MYAAVLLGCGFIYGPHFARFGDADAQMLLFYVLAMIFMLESRNWKTAPALRHPPCASAWRS